MSKEKRKATITITVTSEEGRKKVVREFEGKNKEIELILKEFGILGEKEREILND